MWLNPLGFSKEEAEIMVGKHIVQLTENATGKKVSGRVGQIVAAEQKPTFIGNRYEYFVAVQWRDRDGNVSKSFCLNKQQIKHYTRPLRIQEIAASQHAQNLALGIRQQNNNTKKRGFGV